MSLLSENIQKIYIVEGISKNMILMNKTKCKVKMPDGRIVITYLNSLPQKQIRNGKIKIIEYL